MISIGSVGQGQSQCRLCCRGCISVSRTHLVEFALIKFFTIFTTASDTSRFHLFKVMSLVDTCCYLHIYGRLWWTIFQQNVHDWNKAKEKYRGVFEIQRSGDKTSSGEIGLDIRTHASPKVGQDQVSGGVSVLCWHNAPVAYVLWKPCTIR